MDEKKKEVNIQIFQLNKLEPIVSLFVLFDECSKNHLKNIIQIWKRMMKSEIGDKTKDKLDGYERSNHSFVSQGGKLKIKRRID